MQEQKTATLTTIFSEVLANLAFMFTDPDEVDPAPDAQWLETTISYDGPTTGTLRLRCARDFSTALAANLLGTDPDDDNAESITDDAVKELMNILCGQVITAWHGTEQIFDLTIPQIRTLPEPPDLVDDDDPDASVLFVDGHCIQLAHIPGEAGNAV